MYCLTYFLGHRTYLEKPEFKVPVYKIWKKKKPCRSFFRKHRKFSKPCYEHINGVTEWFHDGIKYEVVTTKDLTEINTYVENIGMKTHSFDGNPAVTYVNGTKEWHFYGKLHRGNNLPAVIYSNGDVEYWRYGRRDRWKAPAIIYGNKQYWYEEGQFEKCIV